MPVTLARHMWQLLEPVHATVYFAPEARAAFADAGLKGGWMGYFATRAAPLGPVPAEVVMATFFNFAPDMVRRAIPDAWHFSSPDKALAARLQVADAALRRLLGDDIVASDAVAEAADLVRRAAAHCAPEGRPLYAGNASLPWPEEPHVALWHGATLLREHRGDGHVAALVAAGLTGCEAHLTVVGGGTPEAAIRPWRGWSDEAWDGARTALQERGWLDADGLLTDRGQAARAHIEQRTDELAAAPWRALGDDACHRLDTLLRPVADRIMSGGGIPVPNPMGLTPAS
jgi:hypothetical protein